MSDYENMTVAQLKELLKELGLAVSGKKADLIARLEAADDVSQEIEEDADDDFDDDDFDDFDDDDVFRVVVVVVVVSPAFPSTVVDLVVVLKVLVVVVLVVLFFIVVPSRPLLYYRYKEKRETQFGTKEFREINFIWREEEDETKKRTNHLGSRFFFFWRLSFNKVLCSSRIHTRGPSSFFRHQTVECFVLQMVSKQYINTERETKKREQLFVPYRVPIIIRNSFFSLSLSLKKYSTQMGSGLFWSYIFVSLKIPLCLAGV